MTLEVTVPPLVCTVGGGAAAVAVAASTATLAVEQAIPKYVLAISTLRDEELQLAAGLDVSPGWKQREQTAVSTCELSELSLSLVHPAGQATVGAVIGTPVVVAVDVAVLVATVVAVVVAVAVDVAVVVAVVVGREVARVVAVAVPAVAGLAPWHDAVVGGIGVPPGPAP